jgi:hypothetical protein
VRGSTDAPEFVDYVQAASRTRTSPRISSHPPPSGERPREPERRTSKPELTSSGLPRFADPELHDPSTNGSGSAVGLEPETGTGAQLSSSLSRSRMIARSSGGKLAMAFVGAIAVGLFVGAYAISRPGSRQGASHAQNDPGAGIGAPPADNASVGLPAEGGAPGPTAGNPVVPEVPVDQLPKSSPAPPGVLGTPAPTSRRPGRPKGQGSAPAQTSGSARKDKDCDPPFTLDDQGHRQYKLWCLSQ